MIYFGILKIQIEIESQFWFRFYIRPVVVIKRLGHQVVQWPRKAMVAKARHEQIAISTPKSWLVIETEKTQMFLLKAPKYPHKTHSNQSCLALIQIIAVRLRFLSPVTVSTAVEDLLHPHRPQISLHADHSDLPLNRVEGSEMCAQSTPQDRRSQYSQYGTEKR